MAQAAESAAQQLSLTHQLEDFCFQIYIEVELIHSDDSRGPKLYTGTLYGYELDHSLTFPCKIKDLTPLSRLGIHIYNMEADDMEEPFASTTIDLFDRHQRLRQGVWNLELHKGVAADTSLQSTTPGLTEQPTTVELNNQLILI